MAADPIKTLTDKISAGKATAQEMLELASLLTAKAQEEKTKGFAEKINKVKALIQELGLTVEEVIANLKNPPVAIFKWEGNTFFAGTKGKAPAWTKTLKEKLGEAEATKFALNDDGKAWVKKLYNPSK